MNLRINGPKDVLAGTIYLVTGTVIFFWAQSYKMGSVTHMGPGYFPALLGAALCLFGVGAILVGLLAKKHDPIGEMKTSPLFLLMASVISFGLLIDRAGMIVATFFCILFACLPRLRKHPIEVLTIFVALTTFNYIVFIYAFGMNIPVFWWD